jgi:formylglycine-generating enzyme required for sulfatase activity
MFRFRTLLVSAVLAMWPVLMVSHESEPDSNAVPSGSGGMESVDKMILIEGSEFLMGKDDQGDASPTHQVQVSSFYLDRYEVTNAEYFEFCEVTERKLPEYWGLEEYHSGPKFPDHPVVGVSWLDAQAYADWRGRRLPTEAEWEYAARGGLAGADYPFEGDLDSTKANFSKHRDHLGTQPVGSYPPNGYGLHDMAGNVVEWVADYYEADYYSESPTENPTGPEKGKFRVIRGGGWHSGPYCNRVFFRNALPAGWVDINVGFRCAKDVEPAEVEKP